MCCGHWVSPFRKLCTDTRALFLFFYVYECTIDGEYAKTIFIRLHRVCWVGVLSARCCVPTVSSATAGSEGLRCHQTLTSQDGSRWFGPVAKLANWWWFAFLKYFINNHIWRMAAAAELSRLVRDSRFVAISKLSSNGCKN